MSVVVVILLVVLWAWILLPGAVRERRETSPASSVSRFERSMAQLARANHSHSIRGLPSRDVEGREVWVLGRPESVMQGDQAGKAARRRRQVLTVLTAATTVTLAVARTFGGIATVAFWMVAPLLLTYLGLLSYRWVQVSRAEASPLLGPPAFNGAALRSRAQRFREVSNMESSEAAEAEAVRVIDW